MKVSADGFEFDFTDAIDAFIFDEKDKTKPTYHGLSHAMKAVDLIVELEEAYYFIEVKDFHTPNDYNGKDHFNHLREVLKYKYRDTFLYRFSENKIEKPIYYLCLLTLDNALISRMIKEIRIQLPIGRPAARWERGIVHGAGILNEERWNKRYPQWPVSRSQPGNP